MSGYADLMQIDLDHLDGMGSEQLYKHFRKLAERATDGMIRQALDIDPGSPHSREQLVHLYATRRQETCLRLRSLRGED